jgi:hypothetical protein
VGLYDLLLSPSIGRDANLPLGRNEDAFGSKPAKTSPGRS